MNKWFISVLFLLSTSLFLYQHSTGVSWDFSVFSMNAGHFLTGIGYLEIGRPPLASVLMFFGEYIYIIIASLIGLFACLKFSKVYGLKPEVFYSLILSPYVLFMGFQVGTEFLVMSLTILLFSYIGDSLAGFFLSLIVLTQYRTAFNGLFLLFSGKKFFPALLLALLVFLPWLLYNYDLYGDPLYSLLDQFAKNVQAREQSFVFHWDHFFLVSGLLTPVALFGLFTRFKRDRLIDVMMVLFFLIKIVSYLFVPFKTHRYLFDLIIPLAYFAAQGLDRFNYKVSFVIVPITLLLLQSLWLYFPLESDVKYINASNSINDSCMILSNSWVFLNYFGVNAGPAPLELFVKDRLDKGYTLVFFRNVHDPLYVFNDSFISALPLTVNESDFFVINNESVCLPSYDYNTSFVEEVRMDDPSFSFTLFDLIS